MRISDWSSDVCSSDLGPIFDAPPFMTEDRFEPGPDYIPFWQVSTSRIGRWVIDLKTGKATSERLGDRPVELPKIDDRFMGQPYRWGFMVAGERVKSGMRMNRPDDRRGGKECVSTC